MLSLGRGLSPLSPIDKTIKVFDFRTALPPEFSILRADATTCATYRNASGKIVTSAAGTARFDYDASGRALGILIEGMRQNKLALHNASPSSATGLSVTSGSAVLSVVSDTTALAFAGLDQIGNGNVIRINNTGQATQSTVAFSTTFGNTNAHSFSVWARVATAHSPAVTRSGTLPQTISMTSGNVYTRYKLENITGHTATDKIQFTIPAGCDVSIILYQLEEGTFSSSEIITAGTAATRQSDRVRALNLGAASWFNMAQGYMALRYRPYVLGFDTLDQYILYASDGTTNNSIGVRIIKGADRDISLLIRNGGASAFPTSTDIMHIANTVHSTGIAWKADKIMAQQGGVAKSIVPGISMPTTMSELAIGARNGASDPMWGWIEKLEVGTVYKEKAALSNRLYRPGDMLIMGGGQSLLSGYFYSQETSEPIGRNRLTEILSTFSPHTNNLFADGSTGSSAVCKTSDPAETNYWWDNAANTRGPTFTNFYTQINNSGFTPTMVLWSQGETDSVYINAGTTRAQYKQALQAIFTDMRKTLGNIKIFIQRLGRRDTSYSNAANAGMQAIREVQKELAAENPEWIFLGAEIYDKPLYDNLHPTNAGYLTAAERNAKVILGTAGCNGPSIVSAIRSGTTVTVTIAHDGGSDFIPSSGISGFVFKAGGSDIAVNAAVRTNATTITLTLASVPAASPEVLYYGFDSMYGLSIANVIKDNSAQQMPMRTGKVIL